MFSKTVDKIKIGLLLSFVALQSRIAIADPLDSLPSSPDPNATIPEIGKRIEGGMGWLYKFLSSLGVVLGLWLCISSLLRVKAITQEEKQGSLWGAWFGVVVGGLLAFVTTWMWAIGKTAQDVTGAS